MRIARFSIDGNVAFGAVEGDGPDGLVLDIIKGIPYSEFELSGTKVPLNKVRLLPPVLPPNKVVAIGRNYAEHAAELGNEVPPDVPPVAFFKPTTSVIGSGDAIEYPPSFSDEVHHEAELAVVIGRMCREVPRERVKDVIFGYTCANDVTARDARSGRSSGPGPRASTPPARSALGGDRPRPPHRPRHPGHGQRRATPARPDERHDPVHRGPGRPHHGSHDAASGRRDPHRHSRRGRTPPPRRDEVAVTIEGIGTLTNKVIKRG